MADKDAAATADRPTFTPEDLAVLGITDASNDRTAGGNTDDLPDDNDLDHDPAIEESVVLEDSSDKGGSEGGSGADAGKTSAKAGGKVAPAAGSKGSLLDPDDGSDDDDDATDTSAEAEEEATGEGEDATAEADTDADGDVEDAADKAGDKSKDKAADWRKPYLDRIKTRLERELKSKVLAKDYDAEFKKRMSAATARLARYKSADDWMDSRWALEERIASGEFKGRKLPENATAKEIAQYRKDNNIPEKADAYTIPQVPGHEWTKADDPVLNSFKATAHKLNLSQEAVSEVASWYARELQTAMKTRDVAFRDLDKADVEHAEETLRADPDIGNKEFRPTLTLINRMMRDRDNFGEFPEEFWNALGQARDPDGHRLLNNPHMLKFLRSMALSAYGDSEMPSGDERGAPNASRRAEIEEIMKTNLDEYYAQGLDKELSEILNAEAEAAQGRGRRGRRAA